ncbi:uncharacterized protein LOC129916825 [Episyrphus balteatus]|uniref:uncharacterized protein LOC129916825 n=1 Tax=Episyrphus balteatus TaxID=286459 RepID=UPI002485692F|nr:uncharacterized protein LOC129916825 [Episyrphus balteatus]
MYAAAGGASLASRQARQRQRQQNKTKAAQAKLHPASKALAIQLAAGVPAASHQQSRQFHQLPSTYLRTPQAQARKLSASYTAQSKLLLPIDEGDGQSLHTHHVHRHHDFIARTSKLVHRHSGSGGPTFHHSHLTKSATATLPLVSQMDATPPTSPLVAKPIEEEQQHPSDGGRMQMQVPQDSIIVTPATPMASPGHVARDPTTTSSNEVNIAPPMGQLERKCSVYRMRRSDAFEQDMADNAANAAQQFEPLCTDETSLIFKGLPNGSGGHKWQPCAYCEEGICVCEHIECAQGRAAWLERGRRCSVQDNNPTACHRRWVKRNRIQDASLGGSSDDEDFLGVLRGPSTFANAFLYVGLGTIALGLVIAFVGTGEKGFKTVELRLIGPSLIGIGLICCILRILFCICPSHCISSSKKARKKQGNKVDADHTTSLLRGESKRVSIARGPNNAPKYPITHKRSNSKMLNEGMEALRQIATTSLFMQNEQKPSMNRVVPIIKEPEKTVEAPLEMKKLETTNVCEISDDEENDEDENTSMVVVPITSTTITNNTTTTTSIVNERPPLVRTSSKLSRQRLSLNQQQQLQQKQHLMTQTSSESGDLLMETSLMVINPTITTTAAIASGSSSKGSVTIRPPPSPTQTTTTTAIASTSTSKTTTTTTIPSSSSPPKASKQRPPPLSQPPVLPSTSSNTLSPPPAVQSMSLHVQHSPPLQQTNFDLPPSTPHKYTRAVVTTTTTSAASPSSSTSLSPTPAPSITTTAAIMTQYQQQQQQQQLNVLPGQVIEKGNLLLLPTSKLATPSLPGCSSSPISISNSSSIESKTRTTPHLATAATSSNNSSSSSMLGNTLIPPPPTPSAAALNFEPELLLSPAKLGQ